MRNRWAIGVSLAAVLALLSCGGGADQNGLNVTPGTGPTPPSTFPIAGVGFVGGAYVYQPIQGLTVQAKMGGQVAASAVTSYSGRFSLVVPLLNAGQTYDIAYSGAGYLACTYAGVKTEGSRIDLPPMPMIMEQYGTGQGTIEGNVINDLTGLGLAGVEIKFRSGMNATTGDVVTSATTTASGTYATGLVPAGYYTAECARTGFTTTHFLAVCLGGRTSSNQNGTTNPQLGVGQWRIVLTWGEEPYDLDSHFTGPTPEGGRFHILWSNKTYGSITNLDLDDTTSFGPETTTLLQQSAGVYRFYVHDFTNREVNTTAMSLSNAQVKVYGSKGLAATFYVPAGVAGNVWTVFELNGGTLRTINTVDYRTDTGSLY